jgi:hypothetical protein
VLTDRLHKNAFKLHVQILRTMFTLVESGFIVVPLSQNPGMDNRQFVREYVANFLITSFPHLTAYVGHLDVVPTIVFWNGMLCECVCACLRPHPVMQTTSAQLCCWTV